MAKELDRLRKLINESDIPSQEQNDLLVFLPILPQSAIEKLYELFQENPKLIKSFNEDFQSRLDILIDGRDKWQKLIDKEEKILGQEEEKTDPFEEDDDPYSDDGFDDLEDDLDDIDDIDDEDDEDDKEDDFDQF